MPTTYISIQNASELFITNIYFMMKQKYNNEEIFNAVSTIFCFIYDISTKDMLVTLAISAEYISEFVLFYLKPKKANF